MTEPAPGVKPRRRLAVAAAALIAALTLAACSAGGSSTTTTGGASSTAPSLTTSTSTSTTTSTTLPYVTDLQGTAKGGAYAGLGLVHRVSVSALAPGTSTLPEAAPGSAAYLSRVPVAYRSFGAGPNLVLVNGQDASMASWQLSLVEELASHYRVTLFDLPGTGYSGAPTDPLTVAWLADLTAGLLVSLQLTKPVVLGWGLGGEVALALAERHEALVASLVLADTASGGPAAVPPKAAVSVLLATPGLTPAQLSAAWFPNDPAGQVARLAWLQALFGGSSDWLTEASIVAEGALQSAAWADPSLTSGLASVTVPVLVVTGSDDLVFPPANSRRLAASLSNARLVVLPDAGYAAIFEDGGEFATALENFTG